MRPGVGATKFNLHSPDLTRSQGPGDVARGWMAWAVFPCPCSDAAGLRGQGGRQTINVRPGISTVMQYQTFFRRYPDGLCNAFLSRLQAVARLIAVQLSPNALPGRNQKSAYRPKVAVSEVAHRLGSGETSRFTAAFRRGTDVAPTAFRCSFI
jgi:AraC-like DNA-binding protein